MCDVILDGERVVLGGPAPTSWSEVRAGLEALLAGRGRVLAALTIGSQPFDESLGHQLLAGAPIEAVSLALAEAMAQVGAALVPEIVALRAAAGTLAREVLRAPWSDVQARCVQQVEAATQVLQRAVDVAALGGEESAAAHAVSALASTVETWMEAIQANDAAAVALQLDGGVAPAWEKLAGLWQGEVAP